MSKLTQPQQRKGPGSHGGGPAGALLRPPEKAKDFKKTFNRLLTYLAPHKIKFALAFALAVLSSAFSVICPKVLGLATTELSKGVMASYQGNLATAVDFSYIGKILAVISVLYIFSALSSFVLGFIMSDVSQKTVYTLRKDAKTKLDSLPMKYFDTNSNGEILSRIINDTDNIAQTLQQSLSQLISALVTMVGMIIVMFVISPWLTLITLVTIPASVFLTMSIAKKSQKHFVRQQRTLGEINTHAEEMLSAHKVVKAFGRESESVARFKDINDELYNAAVKAQFTSGIMQPILNLVNNVGYVFVCAVGGYLVANGVIKIGDVQAFLMYTRQFSQPIVQTANIANVIQSTVASAERVFELLDEEEEEPVSSDTLQNPKTAKSIVFDNIQFGYSEDNVLIKNINLDIKKGQTVAIVGHTGAGKTTLVNLILRFYELFGGRILIDGVDIKTIKREELRSMFGMVLQDTWLFSGTVMENISYAKDNAKTEDAIAAAKDAYADKFIRTLPKGYDTPINEDATNISAGQKQLLTIARAILKDPEILILDEATSSVDTRTELLIQKAMDRLMKGRTTFVIAHRLSTIKNADVILVMKKGAIVEQGTHESLMERRGTYFDMQTAV